VRGARHAFLLCLRRMRRGKRTIRGCRRVEHVLLEGSNLSLLDFVAPLADRVVGLMISVIRRKRMAVLVVLADSEGFASCASRRVEREWLSLLCLGRWNTNSSMRLRRIGYYRLCPEERGVSLVRENAVMK